MVQLIVEPKVVEVGEEITITIKSNIDGNINIDLPSSYVQGGSLMQGSEQEIDGISGRVITYYYVSQNGTVTKEGNVTFGPAYIKRNRKVFKSNSVTIKVEKDQPTGNSSSEFSTKQLKKPAFGVIEKSKSKIYEGEPLVLSAKVYARYNPTHIEGYEPYELEGALEKHEIGSDKDISMDVKTIRGIEYFCFETNKQVLFPFGVGKHQITPFKMDLKKGFDGYVFSSSSASVEVIPLPSNAPKDFMGGVGKFSIEKKLSNKKTLKQGEFIELTLVVKGEGNIHAVNSPEFTLPKEMTLYGDPIEEEAISFGSNGSQGSITYKYNIQLKEGGNIYFPTISFSYFDPKKQRYIQLKEEGEWMNILPDEQAVLAKIRNQTVSQPKEELNIAPIKKIVKSNNKQPFLTSPFFVLVLISPIGLAFLFVFIRKRKHSASEIKDQKRKQKEVKEAAKAEIEKAEIAFNSTNRDQFYSAIQKSLIVLCSSIVKEDVSLISKSNLVNLLIENDLESDVIEEIQFVFQSCEEARYGLGNETETQEILLQKAKQLVNDLSTK